MGKQPTIKDVAREAGVSTTTVSRYLNKATNITSEIAQRIEQAIKQTNYHPNLLARGLKTNNSQMIALIVPDICNPFYSLMAKTAQRAVEQYGYLLSFHDTDNDPAKEEAALHLAQQQNCSGILYASIDFRTQALRQLQQASIPVVGLNAYSENFPSDLVHVSDGGTYLAMQHLLQLGHKRIAFVGGTPSSMISVSRRRGYTRAMKEAGLTWNSDDIFEMGFTQEDGYKAGRYFCTFNPLPTAICCANDQIALGLIEALQDLGVSVPEQISVTGMDDIPYSRLAKPSLTTVTNDGAQFAQTGVQLLLERINGTYIGEKRTIEIPNQLIKRNSTCSLT